jgi:hypothetical protein
MRRFDLDAWKQRWSQGLLLELSALSWLLFLPYILTAHGHLDYARHAIGRDFINLWTASHLEFTPARLDIFDPPKFLGWERRLFDPRLPFHFWSYPPPALFLSAPLAPLPYLPALAFWSAAGVLCLIPAGRAFFGPRSPDRLLILAAPAVAVNIGLGQNGAVTGALLLAGLGLFDRRPRLAGALLGLLVFKPQLALLLPVAAIAARRWSFALAGASSALAILLLSVLVFGPAAWSGFFGPTLSTQETMLAHGHGPFMWMMPSVMMSARALGAPTSLAEALQIPFAALGAALAWRAYRGSAPVQARAAVLILASVAATPQIFNYDLIPASAAALVLCRRGDWRYRLPAVVLWALPVLLLAAQAVQLPPGPPVVLVALWAAYVGLRHAEGEGASPRREARSSMAGEAVSKT